MKKICIALCLVMAMLVISAFAGCAVQPYAVEWHLCTYEIDGEVYEVGFNDFDHFNPVYPDYAQISFDENGSFYFKSKDGVEYNGTYESKDNRNNTETTLTFPDGSKVVGTCARYGFDGYTSYAEFEIYGVKYNFEDKKCKFDEDDLEYRLSYVVGAVYSFAETGETQWPYYDTGLYNGTVAKVGDSYVAIKEYDSYVLDNLKYWCYNVNSKEIEECELKEGECIIRIGNGRLAIYYPEIDKPEVDKK